MAVSKFETVSSVALTEIDVGRWNEDWFGVPSPLMTSSCPL